MQPAVDAASQTVTSASTAASSLVRGATSTVSTAAAAAVDTVTTIAPAAKPLVDSVARTTDTATNAVATSTAKRIAQAPDSSTATTGATTAAASTPAQAAGAATRVLARSASVPPVLPRAARPAAVRTPRIRGAARSCCAFVSSRPIDATRIVVEHQPTAATSNRNPVPTTPRPPARFPSDLGASASSGGGLAAAGAVGALLALFLLAVPRPARRLRPGPTLARPPAFVLLPERPG